MTRSSWARALVAACGLGVALAPAAPLMADEEHPYNLVDGKVDAATFNGYRRYGDYCLRCHGPDALGSSYAPNLTDSLKTLSYDQFMETVINGRQNLANGQEKVMPAFGMVTDVATYIDDIYGYVKARSDDAIPRGRPQKQ